LPGVIAESERDQRAWGGALDRAAIPAAFASAVPGAAMGVSVLGAAVAALGLANSVAATTVAVLMLLPLSAFEAITALPAAAVALSRARAAARRLLDLAGSESMPPTDVESAAAPYTGELAAVGVRSGYAGSGAGPFTLVLAPGARTVVTGPSGCGKTALLMTLAGLLTPREGTVTLGGRPLRSLSDAELRRGIGFFAEDAHLFDTTVRDNLLVVRGDCTDDEILEALQKVGLRPWLAGLPAGLDTLLTGGAQSVSAGQRRRLLLARALISRASVVLLDEPTEHLDAGDAEMILDALLDHGAGLFDIGQTVVVATHQMPNDTGAIDVRSVAAGIPQSLTAAI
jgi:ATP-binding cassette, subfamily C, bacterial CydC